MTWSDGACAAVAVGRSPGSPGGAGGEEGVGVHCWRHHVLYIRCLGPPSWAGVGARWSVTSPLGGRLAREAPSSGGELPQDPVWNDQSPSFPPSVVPIVFSVAQRIMSEAGSADGAGQPKHRLSVVCARRAEGRNVRHFNPESFPVGFVPKEGDNVHAASIQRAAEAGARLAAVRAAAAAPYPLRRLLQEVQRSHEALPAHQQPRQGETAQLGPMLPPGVPRAAQAALLPAATPCDEGRGWGRSSGKSTTRRGRG